ncbi:hypothetical protein A5630_20875 [Mycolicibacterium mucogenicum]|uniref:Uncharacterized protein n=2 Tax=Mycolicibacterium mucogenicum TaxID=56689 RepID=A0A1A3H4E9_MYCMU|nr:hypothetical protein A5630_20875 [Mycolicibacterium mucogenicum]
MPVSVSIFIAAAIALAPAAAADTADTVRTAVGGARGDCRPLRPSPMMDQAAAQINKTTDDWINFTSRSLPETDALPVLKDLGYGGSTSAILSAASATEVGVVKATLLQGYAKIPDCSYSDIGVSTTYNQRKRLILTTVVLAG